MLWGVLDLTSQDLLERLETWPHVRFMYVALA